MAKGILALLGSRKDDDASDEGEDLSPEAQAVKDMLDAHERGDDEAAGKAFKRAYRICAASKGQSSGADEESSEDDEEY
jgi:hypothetical protein